jgi:hypothetical protein
MLFTAAPLALAACMPTAESKLDGATASLASAAEPAFPQPPLLNIDRPFVVAAPLPPKRPDFEGVKPASRALGAVVADAEEVDKALEEHADEPNGGRPGFQIVSYAPSTAPARATFASGDYAGPAGASILYSGLAAAPGPALAPTNAPGYYASYEDTDISCFPSALRDALNAISAHYNAPVEVTSGMRFRGRAHSMHRFCMAADIRVPGVAPQTLAAFAKTVDNVNGVGTYRYNTVTHIDVRQDRMAWRY